MLGNKKIFHFLFLTNLTGFYLRFFVRGEVDSKNILDPHSGEKIYFRPSRGSGDMLPRKILKR